MESILSLNSDCVSWKLLYISDRLLGPLANELVEHLLVRLSELIFSLLSESKNLFKDLPKECYQSVTSGFHPSLKIRFRYQNTFKSIKLKEKREKAC